MHAVDEIYAVYDEQNPTARKEHVCCACSEVIRKGHSYYRVSVVFDGGAETFKRCSRCQVIHKHLRDVGDGDGWPDENLNCGSGYEDEHGGPPPDNIAALAFALPGETQ